MDDNQPAATPLKLSGEMRVINLDANGEALVDERELDGNLIPDDPRASTPVAEETGYATTEREPSGLTAPQLAVATATLLGGVTSPSAWLPQLPPLTERVRSTSHDEKAAREKAEVRRIRRAETASRNAAAAAKGNENYGR